MEIRFPVKVELLARNAVLADDVELRAVMSTYDRDTGEPTRVIQTDFPPAISSLEDPGRYLRGFLLRLLAHELDETLRVDGRLLHDPHTGDTYVPRYV